MTEDSRPEDNSDIVPISLPVDGFESRIPPYLLDGKSESEKFILTEVSKMSHFIEFMAPIIVATHVQTRKTNGRLKAVEAWKTMFTSWWVLVGAILSLVGGVAGIVAIIEFFFGTAK